MRPEVLKRYAGPVPRYTSYPTAPHFSTDIDSATYIHWLAAVPQTSKLSLYVHIPYCQELCWYCGCTTTATQKYEPVSRYLGILIREIEGIAQRLPDGIEVSHIHWGGGSPNILSPSDIMKLSNTLRRHFNVISDAEFAIEVDPRTAPESTVQAFAEAGVNRVSIGVQDFDVAVQKAINRMQSFEMTEKVVSAFRSVGIGALNIDLVYGLPHQTQDTTYDTIQKVLRLKPDRVALFGYAHLPQRIKHQQLIDDNALPGTMERFAQSSQAASMLQASGYLRVGLDHFVSPNDRLAQAQVHRNFQGYTDDEASVLVGLGASSIGRLPQGYVQNAPNVRDYGQAIEACGAATVRGHEMTAEDAVRGFTIERLMCDLRFPAKELRDKFGARADAVIKEAQAFLEMENDGLVEPDPDNGPDNETGIATGNALDNGIFRVTDKGRSFVRSICSVFDSYLDAKPGIGSQGV